MKDLNDDEAEKFFDLVELLGAEQVGLATGDASINVDAPVKYLRADEGGVSHFRYGRDNLLLTWMHTRLMIEFVLRLPLLAATRDLRHRVFADLGLARSHANRRRHAFRLQQAHQRRPRQARGVHPAGTRELDLVFDRLAGEYRGHALVAERLADRSWLDLREVLREDLHGALHLADAVEARVLVFGLLLQLRIARQCHHADERENRDRHQDLEQREAARACRAC